MPVVRQQWITEQDLKNNPETLYVFGDNVERKGFGGQAKVMRGKKNAVGIATKWAPTNLEEDFFSDDDFDQITSIIISDFKPVVKALADNKTVIIPVDGLGTGLSRLPEKAPRVFQFLENCIKVLENFDKIETLPLFN